MKNLFSLGLITAAMGTVTEAAHWGWNKDGSGDAAMANGLQIALGIIGVGVAVTASVATYQCCIKPVGQRCGFFGGRDSSVNDLESPQAESNPLIPGS